MKARTVRDSLVLMETVIISPKSERKTYPDLTQEEGSVGQRLEKLIQTADIYEDVDDIKDAFRQIINAEDTYISDRKKNGYELDMRRIYSLDAMRRFLTNVYLKAANLGLS